VNNIMQYYKRKQSGFFLIEVVIAVALAGGVLITVLSLVQDTVEVSQRSLEKTQAAYLLDEGIEGVKSIRDDAWTTITGLSSGTPYYLLWNGTKWTLTTTAQTVGGFTRTIVFEDVYRDGNDDIVSSGGTLDIGTRKGTVTLSWDPPSGAQSESIVFYIGDIRTYPEPEN
jgi:type II secretory pathway pseudopilin PulG